MATSGSALLELMLALLLASALLGITELVRQSLSHSAAATTQLIGTQPGHDAASGEPADPGPAGVSW